MSDGNNTLRNKLVDLTCTRQILSTRNKTAWSIHSRLPGGPNCFPAQRREWRPETWKERCPMATTPFATSWWTWP